MPFATSSGLVFAISMARTMSVSIDPANTPWTLTRLFASSTRRAWVIEAAAAFDAE